MINADYPGKTDTGALYGSASLINEKAGNVNEDGTIQQYPVPQKRASSQNSSSVVEKIAFRYRRVG